MKLRSILSLVAAVVATHANAALIPVATWEFNGTLAANEAGAPALTAIDPLGLNSFIVDNVFGDVRPVYRYDGNAFPPAEQAGVSVSANGLLDAGNSYSIDMTFQLEVDGPTWELLIGTSNRSSDNGFYVEPGHRLQIYPVGDGPNLFTFGEYHRVTLTNNGLGHVTAYLDGNFQFDLTTNVMDFTTYAGANPNRLIHFFADNIGDDGGFGEFVDGRIALIRLYDGELTSGEVREIGTAPEPVSLALLGLGLAGLGFARRNFSRS